MRELLRRAVSIIGVEGKWFFGPETLFRWMSLEGNLFLGHDGEANVEVYAGGWSLIN